MTSSPVGGMPRAPMNELVASSGVCVDADALDEFAAEPTCVVDAAAPTNVRVRAEGSYSAAR